MGEGDTEQFFRQKRPWSRQKDEILKNYLTSYIPKVAQGVGKPILIVDGFAGPGCFDDGSLGSPLIIAQTIAAFDALPFDVKMLAIEENATYFNRLRDQLTVHAFARCEHGQFSGYLPEIRRAATTHSVFLFVDPYALQGLDFELMESVFKLVKATGSSVEVLLNFNAWAFGRTALQARRYAEDQTHLTAESMSSELLDSVAGGDWWRSLVDEHHRDFDAMVNAIMDGFAKRLGRTFNFVAFHKVMESYKHKIPKYYLVFGSRSSRAAAILMNDVMAVALRGFIDEQAPTDGMLFDVRPTEFAVDPAEIDPLLLELSKDWITRGDLVWKAIHANYGRMTQSEINRRVSGLLRDRKLRSASGKIRINDDEKLIRL